MRYLAIITITALALVACGGSGNGSTNTNETSATSTPRTTATTQAAAEPTATTARPVEPTPTTAPAEPTNTAAPTATQRPTNTPAPTATATVESVANVEVLDWKAFQDSINYYHVVGVLQNSGNIAAQQIQVVVSLYDATGTILGSGTASTVLPIIPAGAKTGFATTIADVDAATVADTKIQVQFAPLDTTSFDGEYYNVTDLVVEQVSWTADKIVGVVVNNGDGTVETRSVIVVGYNGDGTLFGVETAYIQLDELAPGMSSPFDTSLFGTGGAAPATVEAWAYGVNP